MFFPLADRGPSGRKAAIGKGNRTNLHFSFTSTTGHRARETPRLRGPRKSPCRPCRDIHPALIEDADRLGNNASWRRVRSYRVASRPDHLLATIEPTFFGRILVSRALGKQRIRFNRSFEYFDRFFSNFSFAKEFSTLSISFGFQKS